MRYTQPLSDQVLIFISSIGPGVIIGFLYDVIFSFFRTFGNKRALTIAADLIFSVVTTLLSFFYMVVYNSGVVRLNIIIAQLIGAIAFHYTIGRYVEKGVCLIARLMNKLIKTVFFPLTFIVKKSAGFIKNAVNKTAIKEKNAVQKKKINNIIKILLKK